jgi:hypothetical protein
MRADDVRTTEAIRHGAYVCLNVPASAHGALTKTAIGALASRLGLQNEFESTGGDPPEAIAYLRRVGATSRDIEYAALLRSDAIVHVAAPTPEPVAEFCAELSRLLPSAVKPYVLAGVVRPMNYTGNAMHNFAYAHRVLQQPGTLMPNAFLVPMRKTPAWWQKDWMERHTYFLPRYDGRGSMRSEGHALAAAAGIPHLMRRTYRNMNEPAPAGEYDFLNCFECTDEHVATFHNVCRALRDVTKNPEWAFVREGPTWHGRRVQTWTELFA